MPVNQYGNEDLTAFFHGAQVGNMLVQQRERAQELASQEALRAVQERHLAAQTDQLAYTLQQAREDKMKEDQDLQTANLLHHTLTETTDATPEQATQATDQWLLNKNPKLAMKVGQARALMEKPQLAQQALQARQEIATGHDVAKVQAAQISADARIKSTRSPNGYAPSVTEKDALALQKADDAVDQAYADGDAEGITRAEKFRDNLNAGFERQHPDQVRLEGVKALRTELGVVLKEYWSGGRDEKLVPKINALKDQIKAVTTKASDTSAPAASAPAPSTPKRFKLDINSGKLVPIQ